MYFKISQLARKPHRPDVQSTDLHQKILKYQQLPVDHSPHWRYIVHFLTALHPNMQKETGDRCIKINSTEVASSNQGKSGTASG